MSQGYPYIQAYDLVTSGCQGSLHSWYWYLEKKEPGTHQKWRTMVFINNDPVIAAQQNQLVGSAMLDVNGQPVSNAIGQFIWALLEHFVGGENNTKQVNSFWLYKMKCKDLTQFQEHFNQFQQIVHQQPDLKDPKYVELCINSLPLWFQPRLFKTASKEDLMKNSLGYLRQAVHAEILSTCQDISFTTKSQKIKAKNYNALCKQRGLSRPTYDHHPYTGHAELSFSSSSRHRKKKGGKYDRNYKSPQKERKHKSHKHYRSKSKDHFKQETKGSAQKSDKKLS